MDFKICRRSSNKVPSLLPTTESLVQWWLIVESVFCMYNYQPYIIKLVQYPSRGFCLKAFWSNHLLRGWVIWNSDKSKMYMMLRMLYRVVDDLIGLKGFLFHACKVMLIAVEIIIYTVSTIILFCLNKNNGSIDLT